MHGQPHMVFGFGCLCFRLQRETLFVSSVATARIKLSLARVEKSMNWTGIPILYYNIGHSPGYSTHFTQQFWCRENKIIYSVIKDTKTLISITFPLFYHVIYSCIHTGIVQFLQGEVRHLTPLLSSRGCTFFNINVSLCATHFPANLQQIQRFVRLLEIRWGGG